MAPIDSLERRQGEYRRFFARMFPLQVTLNFAAAVFAAIVELNSTGTTQFIITLWAFFVTPMVGFYGRPGTAIGIMLVQAGFAFFGLFTLIYRAPLFFDCGRNPHCSGGNEMLFNLWYVFTIAASIQNWVLALRAWSFYNESGYRYGKKKRM